MANPSTYFAGAFESLAAKACLVDTSLPTFAGIASTTPQLDGSFVVTWALATSTKPPVRYEIYVSLGSVTAAALFVTANRVAFAPGALTAWRIFVLRDQVTYFMPGQVYTFGIRAVDSLNFNDTNVVILTSTALYPNYLSLAGAVWDQTTASHVTAGTFGKLVEDTKSNTDTIIGLTAPSAIAADVWDAAFASHTIAGSFGANLQNPVLTAAAVAGAVWDVLQAGHTTANTFGAALQGQLLGIISTTRANNLDNLDATVSSRATQTSVNTVITQTTAAAIAADVWDALVSAHTTAGTFGGELQTSVATPATIATAVWAALQSANTVSGSFGNSLQGNLSGSITPTRANNLDNLDVAVSTRATQSSVNTTIAQTNAIAIASAVWDSLLSAHAVSGTFGGNAQTPAINPTEVAQAVWNALLVDYDLAGSFGANAQNPPLDPSQIASAVWDALISSYDTLGTFGYTVQHSSFDPSLLITITNALANLSNNAAYITQNDGLVAYMGQEGLTATITSVTNLIAFMVC